MQGERKVIVIGTCLEHWSFRNNSLVLKMVLFQRSSLIQLHRMWWPFYNSPIFQLNWNGIGRWTWKWLWMHVYCHGGSLFHSIDYWFHFHPTKAFICVYNGKWLSREDWTNGTFQNLDYQAERNQQGLWNKYKDKEQRQRTNTKDKDKGQRHRTKTKDKWNISKAWLSSGGKSTETLKQRQRQRKKTKEKDKGKRQRQKTKI